MSESAKQNVRVLSILVVLVVALAATSTHFDKTEASTIIAVGAALGIDRAWIGKHIRYLISGKRTCQHCGGDLLASGTYKILEESHGKAVE